MPRIDSAQTNISPACPLICDGVFIFIACQQPDSHSIYCVPAGACPAGHLYVEAVLIKQIEAVAVDKTAIKDWTRLGFSTKVQLAAALGAVDAADVAGINALNKLRNKFAHKCGDEADEARMKKICTTPSHRASAK
jgi:hypothetical protein